MAQFNLDEYETVETRINRLYNDHPNARIVTYNLTTQEDRQKATWVVKAELWLPNPDGITNPDGGWFLKSTGLAFEIDGQGMANKTSALENAETSAIGRCLANAGYSGSKRASRTEMEKVVNQPRAWLTEAEGYASAGNVAQLRLLYTEAKAAKISSDVLEKIQALGSGLAK